MSRGTLAKGRGVAAAALCGAILLTSGACSFGGGSGSKTASSPPPTSAIAGSGVPARPGAFPTSTISGTPAGGLPVAGKLDGKDATAVSRAVVLTMHTFDTTIDNSRFDAVLRSAPYLEATYFERIKDSAPVRGPGAEWAQWREHQAYGVATAELATEMGQPEDSDMAAYRKWRVVVTPTGRDGWKGTPYEDVLFITMVRVSADATWKVTGTNGQAS